MSAMPDRAQKRHGAKRVCAMQFTDLDIEGLLLVQPVRREDSRGHFAETFRRDLFRDRAGDIEFVQDSESRSARRGTIRGLHLQVAPRAQGKLVSVTSGAVLDVAVDVRPGSTTFGRHAAVELSVGNGCQLWIPPGFLHGFCTLADDTWVRYKVTDFYSPGHERSVRWDDPAIGIAWPVHPAEAILSDRDRAAPLLSDLFAAAHG
jgi:dTDP-4-dehydrorhamnose 3,5-epimerase